MNETVSVEAVQRRNLFIIIFGVLSFICSIFMGFCGDGQPVGFGVRFLMVVGAIVVGTPCGIIGAAIGEGIRRITHPDMLWANGVFDMLKKQLFWAIGPQLIGMLIGSLMSGAILIQLLKRYIL